MRGARRALGLVVLAGLAVYACAVYDPSLLVGPVDAGGTPDASEAGPAGCIGERPPNRPEADDPSSGPDLEIVVALNSVDLGLDAGARLSFNLDGKCTCPEEESCVASADSLKHCDDDAGRDNSASPLLKKFSLLSSEFDPSGVNARVQNGATGLLARIQRWNGTPNDRSIDLALLSSAGTKPTSDAGDAGNPVPLRDGKDQWLVASSALQGGVGPPYVAKYSDANAYVANGVVVGLIDFPLALTGGFSGAFLQLRGTYVTAKLVKDARGWALHEGRMSGRWDTKNLLSGLQVVDDPLNPGQFLCGSNLTYQSLKKEICKSADISSNPGNDGTKAPCDAISLGLGFDTDPAIIGGWVDQTKPGKTPCGAQYTDSCQ
jgi:hypothetical protein